MTRVLFSTLATAIRAADLDPSNTTVWSASGSSTAFAGPCAWSPDGGAVWVYGGSGGGGYYGAGGTARRYDAAGAFQFNYASISWAPNCVAYHSSGDLIAGAGSTIYRFESTSGTITATYTATIGTGGGVRRLWVVGDVVYYYTNGVGGGQIRRYDLVAGQLSNIISSVTFPTAIDVDLAGRILVTNTSLITLYDATGSSVDTFSIGAGRHQAASFDPDGASMWVAYGQTVQRVVLATGTVSYTTGSLGDNVQAVHASRAFTVPVASGFRLGSLGFGARGPGF